MIWQLSLQMKAGRRPRVFEFGEQYRDHIYVKDVVDANIKAFEKATPGVYQRCTGRKTDFNAVIAALNQALGTSLAPEYFKNPYSFYQNETLGDPAKARKAFGFASSWTTERGISDYIGGVKTAVDRSLRPWHRFERSAARSDGGGRQQHMRRDAEDVECVLQRAATRGSPSASPRPRRSRRTRAA